MKNFKNKYSSLSLVFWPLPALLQEWLLDMHQLWWRPLPLHTVCTVCIQLLWVTHHRKSRTLFFNWHKHTNNLIRSSNNGFEWKKKKIITSANSEEKLERGKFGINNTIVFIDKFGLYEVKKNFVIKKNISTFRHVVHSAPFAKVVHTPVVHAAPVVHTPYVHAPVVPVVKTVHGNYKTTNFK